MIDLISILDGMPKGLKLYSVLHGEVSLDGIAKSDEPSIVVSVNNPDGECYSVRFDRYGRFLSEFKDGECVLFHSKEDRDWENFKKNVPKFSPLEFEPFQKVLYKNRFVKDVWHCGIVDMVVKDSDNRIRVKVIGCRNAFAMVIPFNNDTEKLHGQEDMAAPEYYNWWKEIGSRMKNGNERRAKKAKAKASEHKPSKSRGKKMDVSCLDMSTIEIKMSRQRRIKNNIEAAPATTDAVTESTPEVVEMGNV